MKIVDLFTCRDMVKPLLVDEKDMTIPNQNQSVVDMIARFTAGVPLPAKEPLWFGDKMPVNATGQAYDAFDVMMDQQKVAIDYAKLSNEFNESVKKTESSLQQKQEQSSEDTQVE